MISWNDISKEGTISFFCRHYHVIELRHEILTQYKYWIVQCEYFSLRRCYLGHNMSKTRSEFRQYCHAIEILHEKYNRNNYVFLVNSWYDIRAAGQQFNFNLKFDGINMLSSYGIKF